MFLLEPQNLWLRYIWQVIYALYMVYTLYIPKYLIQDSLYMVFTLDEIPYKWFITYTCHLTYT